MPLSDDLPPDNATVNNNEDCIRYSKTGKETWKYVGFCSNDINSRCFLSNPNRAAVGSRQADRTFLNMGVTLPNYAGLCPSSHMYHNTDFDSLRNQFGHTRCATPQRYSTDNHRDLTGVPKATSNVSRCYAEECEQQNNNTVCNASKDNKTSNKRKILRREDRLQFDSSSTDSGRSTSTSQNLYITKPSLVKRLGHWKPRRGVECEKQYENDINERMDGLLEESESFGDASKNVIEYTDYDVTRYGDDSRSLGPNNRSDEFVQCRNNTITSETLRDERLVNNDSRIYVPQSANYNQEIYKRIISGTQNKSLTPRRNNVTETTCKAENIRRNYSDHRLISYRVFNRGSSLSESGKIILSNEAETAGINDGFEKISHENCSSISADSYSVEDISSVVSIEAINRNTDKLINKSPVFTKENTYDVYTTMSRSTTNCDRYENTKYTDSESITLETVNDSAMTNPCNVATHVTISPDIQDISHPYMIPRILDYNVTEIDKTSVQQGEINYIDMSRVCENTKLEANTTSPVMPIFSQNKTQPLLRRNVQSKLNFIENSASPMHINKELNDLPYDFDTSKRSDSPQPDRMGYLSTASLSKYFDPQLTVAPRYTSPPSYIEAINRHQYRSTVDDDKSDDTVSQSPTSGDEQFKCSIPDEEDENVVTSKTNVQNKATASNYTQNDELVDIETELNKSDTQWNVKKTMLSTELKTKNYSHFSDTVVERKLTFTPPICEKVCALYENIHDGWSNHENEYTDDRQTDSGIEQKDPQVHLQPPIDAHVDEAWDEFCRIGSDRSYDSSVSYQVGRKHTKIHTSPFSVVPDNVVIAIMSSLKTEVLCRCMRVCRRWFSLAWDESLWKKITINNERVNIDVGLRSLTRQLSYDTPTICVAVQRVCLNGCLKLTDKSLRTTAKRCPELQVLELRGCRRITGDGVSEVVSSCVNIIRLDLTGCHRFTRLPSEILRQANFRHQILISYLDLSECVYVTDDSIREITALFTRLQHLYLRRCRLLTDLSLIAIGKRCSELAELSVSDCNQITDRGVKELKHLVGLRYISLAKCENVSDTSMKVIARSCRKLRYVNVRGCHSVSDDTLVLLAKHSSGLRSLDVGNCDVTDESLVEIARNCPHLRKLSLKFCDTITDDGIVAIAVNCTHLQQLNMYGCHVTTVGYRSVKRNCRHCIIEHNNPGFT